jgi:hypothetical protein
VAGCWGSTYPYAGTCGAPYIPSQGIIWDYANLAWVSTATLAPDISCCSAVYGCMDNGNCTVATCGYDSNNPTGCTPGTNCVSAFNYYAGATIDDGSCTYIPGCTDSTACNYNPLAGIDDGSCCYVACGCTDPLATNYDASATCDDGSCVYPCILPQNPFPFNEGFESGDFVVGNWTPSRGADVDSNYPAVTGGVDAYTYPGSYQISPMSGSFSVTFTGYSYTGWNAGGSSTTTSAQAWGNNASHHSAVEMCVDLFTASGSVTMTMGYDSSSFFGNPSGNYSWFRVLVNGVAIADSNGHLDHHEGSQTTVGVAYVSTLSYDLSAYIGTIPTITLQASCKYGPLYSGGTIPPGTTVADYVVIDNVQIT